MEFEKVRKIVAEQFNISIEKITEKTSFKDDLNADSLDVFQLITALEEEFDMQFKNEDINSIKTVGNVADYLKNLK